MVKKVTFWARKPVKVQKKVCFKTTDGRKVCFVATKKIPKIVKVSFKTKRK